VTSPTAAYAVHVAGKGNVYMREIAELVVAALRDLGRDTELRVDELPTAVPGQVDLVVAPHELFTLLEHVPLDARREAARRSVCIGVEQPGTTWFEISAGFSALGPMALDINPLAVAELRKRRVDARRLPLGYHESWDRWSPQPDRPRPTDIVFLGAATPDREAWVSEHGSFLAGYECDLRFFGIGRPVDGGESGFLVGDDKRERLATAKVILNLHRSTVPYFEWVRALEAIANGCVFLTETSTGIEPLVPFEHLVAAPRDELAGWAGALLADPSRRDELASRAHRFVRDSLSFTDLLGRVLPEVERSVALARDARHRRIDIGAVVRNKRREATALARHAGGSIKHRVARRLRGRAVGDLDDVDAGRRQQLKDMALANRRLQRRIEAMESTERFGEPHHVTLTTNAAWDGGAEPEVSVVVPLYNYAHMVDAAIDSVVASQGVGAELIIVDDHSSDSSLDAALAKQAALDWFPIAVASKATNAGLSAARNTGFEIARTAQSMLLDADNTLEPRCLRLLLDALEQRDESVGFAYGIVARYGDELNLTSHLPWDPVRLCSGNYIDAMAMVRRSAWEAAGGWDPSIDERFGGWEDYELWLHLAALGIRGTLVPQVVARYWYHGESMLALLNLETDSLRSELRARYPMLPWPASVTPAR